jgi:predicted alpha-1,2-mannosidase
MNKKILIFTAFLLSALAIHAQQPVDYVDCFIGTSNSRWMLGPYAQLPFGMVQLGPDNQSDVWMGGYEYSMHSISGFSHIHAWTMGGLMMMPTTADFVFDNPHVDSPFKGANAGYHSRILKNTEKATPGYYEVELYDHQTKVEITATTRCGFQRYTYPKCKESRILIDLQFPTEHDYGFKVLDAKITKVSNTELEGYADCRSGAWASWNDYKLHFVVRLSRPVENMSGWNNNKVTDDITEISGQGDIGVVLKYNTNEGDVIMVQTGLSLVSIEGARKNLDAELSLYKWDFDQVANDARNTWNKLLGRIQVEGGSETDKKKFYTNLYRTFSGKQTWNDVDGKYRDAAERIQQLQPGQSVYGGDAFWNTYWNLNGLWSIVAPELIDNCVTTQLEMYDKTGWTCKGPAGIEYSGIMEGSHEIALMVAAYNKGIRKDGERIYEAIRHTAATQGINMPNGAVAGQVNLDAYDKFGYMPVEQGVISKTLDYAYDDYCTGILAKTLGKNKDADFFLQRSQNYRNAFHPASKYVCRRDEKGNWVEPLDIFSGEGFIEGNSWQYSWYVPHDPEGLLNLIGREAAYERLHEGFEKSREHNFAAHAFDRTEGQSAEYYINQGNEVNMSSAFLFNYLDRPWLTQQYTREILDRFYGATPYEGWEGDEDEGQMGAWFVMSSLGLFEMTGGVEKNSMVELTSPLFNKITIDLSDKYYNGGTFVIKANNNSAKNIYIQSATLNGKKLNQPRISFSDIVKGGELVLEMGDKPQNLGFTSLNVADFSPDPPKVIAHRGYWDVAGSAQNSIASLTKTQELGVYGSEFDVWLTIDGRLVINHDDNLIINGSSLRIDASTYDQIKDFTLSNGEKLPTLEDYLSQGKKDPNTKLILEIKTHNTTAKNNAVVAAVVVMVNDSNMTNQVEYIAFDMGVCKELVKLQPNAKVAYLNGGLSPQALHDLGLSGLDYTITEFRNHPSWIVDAHNLGMTTNVWTINSEAEMLEMKNAGVDYITTDKPH